MGARQTYSQATHRSLGRPGTHCGGPRRTGPYPVAAAAMAVAIILAATACSREARHQVLAFFYDGVPPLDAGTARQVIETSTSPPAATAGEGPSRAPLTTEVYRHPHYRKSLCGSCHDAGGGLLKTVRQGLCQTCHFVKPEEKKEYLHGPVAINDCLACHRYHVSRYPKILVTDAQTLCSHCHEREGLIQDRHHATMDKDRCIDCHDSHGGDNRFFLLPGVVQTDPSGNALIIDRTR